MVLAVANPLTQTFPSSLLSMPHSCNFPVFLSCLCAGLPSVYCTAFSYRCVLAPSSGNVFHYVWLRCYTDCGCLDGPIFPPRLYNINTKIVPSQLLQHLLVRSLVGANQVWYKSFPIFGPHYCQCNFDGHIFLS